MSGLTFWFLRLNDMRDCKIEYSNVVCWAETEQELLDLLEGEKVKTYKDDRWDKSYRQGVHWSGTTSRTRVTDRCLRV